MAGLIGCMARGWCRGVGGKRQGVGLPADALPEKTKLGTAGGQGNRPCPVLIFRNPAVLPCQISQNVR